MEQTVGDFEQVPWEIIHIKWRISHGRVCFVRRLSWKKNTTDGPLHLKALLMLLRSQTLPEVDNREWYFHGNKKKKKIVLLLLYSQLSLLIKWRWIDNNKKQLKSNCDFKTGLILYIMIYKTLNIIMNLITELFEIFTTMLAVNVSHPRVVQYYFISWVKPIFAKKKSL